MAACMATAMAIHIGMATCTANNMGMSTCMAHIHASMVLGHVHGNGNLHGQGNAHGNMHVNIHGNMMHCHCKYKATCMGMVACVA